MKKISWKCFKWNKLESVVQSNKRLNPKLYLKKKSFVVVDNLSYILDHLCTDLRNII